MISQIQGFGLEIWQTIYISLLFVDLACAYFSSKFYFCSDEISFLLGKVDISPSVLQCLMWYSLTMSQRLQAVRGTSWVSELPPRLPPLRPPLPFLPPLPLPPLPLVLCDLSSWWAFTQNMVVYLSTDMGWRGCPACGLSASFMVFHSSSVFALQNSGTCTCDNHVFRKL